MSQARGHNKGQDGRQKGHHVGQGVGVMRDNIKDNMVIVWAKVGGIMRNKMAEK